MKKQFATALIVALTLSTGIFSAIAAQDDPVLMTVNGKDIHVSEFEYLYNKNNSQQMQPESIEDYVEKFINYKLKVADAEAAGIDKTKSFIDEFNQYEAELAAPYMVDTDLEEQLVQEAYAHATENVLVSHIMLRYEPTREGVDAATVKADSLRNAILAGEITFEEAAANFSQDRPSAMRGGMMGYVIPGRFPYPFEKASYDTEVGQISQPVNSGFGIHIIRVEKREPNPGEVKTSHILRLTRGKTDEEAAAQKALIDSLYTVAKAGADFAELAKEYSEDPGSARHGGDLDWYGRGAMVQPFDSISFALNIGEISEPFATSYGYHIIYKTDARPVASLEEMRSQLENQIKGDERGQLPAKSRLNEYISRYNSRIITSGLDAAQKIVEDNGAVLDSLTRSLLAQCQAPVVEVDGKTWPVADIIDGVAQTAARGGDNARMLISSSARKFMEDKTRQRARKDIAAANPDLQNLVNEYRDGILLFEISNRNVWERAAQDKKGLEEFFAKNRKKYAWDAPRFKGYVMFAQTDSLLQVALQYADSVFTGDPTAFVADMRSRFGRDVKIERVIAAKGENAITDYLAFGGEKPESESSRWACYAAYQGRIIDAPEEAADVRGQAVTDYQSLLEEQWVKQLRKKYKHKVNKSVLQSLK